MKTILTVIGLILVVYLSYRTFGILTLSDGLKAKMAKGAVLLDVRTAEEFNTGHIKGATNVSLGTIRGRLGELDTSKTYIVYCSHGLRSVKAENLLKEAGFHHVYNGGAMTDLEKIVP